MSDWFFYFTNCILQNDVSWTVYIIPPLTFKRGLAADDKFSSSVKSSTLNSFQRGTLSNAWWSLDKKVKMIETFLIWRSTFSLLTRLRHYQIQHPGKNISSIEGWKVPALPSQGCSFDSERVFAIIPANILLISHFSGWDGCYSGTVQGSRFLFRSISC